MIPCPSRADLQNLLAEQLPAEQERALLAHVESCPACQQTLEELTAFRVPGPADTAAEDAWPPGEPSSDTGPFWRGLKAAFPGWPATVLTGHAAGLPVGGKKDETEAVLPTRLGRYELLEEIGRGGMGTVLRGYDPDLGRDLAVKVLRLDHQHDPAAVSRFTEEAQIGGQLQHPGIVPVYEVGRSADQRPYFTMKLVKGRTLAARLRERSNPRQDLPHLEQVFEQVCQTMAYAHFRGVIHRDLKPANVMVGAFGEVQVMDWGLAKVLEREGGTSSIPSWCAAATGGLTKVLEGEGELPTRSVLQPPGNASGVVRTVRSTGSGPASQPGHVLGTPAYMAPEQASGEVDRLDERCDVFGLGAILCEILTGQPPYVGADNLQVLNKAAHGDLAEAFARLDACGADPELIRLARSSLTAEVADRPRDAGVLAAELAAHRESMEARLRQAELDQAEARARAEEERKRQRLTAALAAAGLALVLLAAGGGLWLRQVQTERRAEAERQEQALRQEVEATLTQAVSFRKGLRFREAWELLEQAGQRLERAGPDDLRRRPSQARDDLALAERLDAARLQAATIVEGKLDQAGGERKYAAAFAGAGFDWEGEDVTALAARVQDSAVREEIVAALDDWASLTPDGAHQERLMAVARAADPDRWRDRLRQPLLWRDRGALTKLADEAKEAELAPQLATALGRVLRNGGGNAVPLLAAAQARFPQDFWISFELAGAFYQAQRWDEAAGYYLAALALRPQAAAGYNNLGVALHAKGRLDEAIKHFQKALRLDGTYAQAHTNLGLALKDKGHLEEAIEHYEQALRIDPKLAAAHNNLGNALHAKGRLDEAIDRYQQALRIDTTSVHAHTNLGNALAAKGRLEEAIDHFQQALRIDPKFAPTHYNFGNTLKDKGQLEEAIGHYEQALRLDPTYVQAHTNLGVALAAKGRTDEAIEHYQKALALDPKLVQAHTNLGNALHAKGRLDEAISHYEQALRIDPTYALAHYNLANVLKDKGRPDKIIEHYEQALRFDPKYAPAHTNLGVALAAKGRTEEAIEHYEQALRIDPKLVQAHENLGKALLAQGRFHEARAATRRCLDLLPQDHPWRPDATQRLQRCEQLLALEGRLPAVLLDGKDKPADAAERLQFAELCLRKKQYAAAARLYAEAFAAKPQLADDPRTSRRYNAACAAARAAAGQGADATALDDTERARWRQQALSWLRADLTTWSRQAEGDTPEDRSTIIRTLTHWEKDLDLASVRDPDELGKLPEDEREAWRKLWTEAEALRKKVQEKKK
jgi:tetratricopeptide (TPR) repeat protein